MNTLDHPSVVNGGIVKNSTIGASVKIMPFVNIYNSTIEDGVFVSPFVELGGCKIGHDTRIGTHSYVCPGVEIGHNCFIGHAVMFTNDKFSDVPEFGTLAELANLWKRRTTVVGNRVRIGSGAVILPVRIGDGAIIGAGSVVTKDVQVGAVVSGNPARFMYWAKDKCK